MSLLIAEITADFSKIKEVTGASSGNISVQITKLEKAKYINVKKTFKDNYPNTELKITKTGIDAFDEYVRVLKEYLPS